MSEFIFALCVSVFVGLVLLWMDDRIDFETVMEILWRVKETVISGCWLVLQTGKRIWAFWGSNPRQEEADLIFRQVFQQDEEPNFIGTSLYSWDHYTSDEYTVALREMDNSAQAVYVPDDLSESSTGNTVINPTTLPEHWAIGDDGEIVDLDVKK